MNRLSRRPIWGITCSPVGILLGCLLMGNVFAQDIPAKDSLHHLWRDSSAETESRLRALNTLIKDHYVTKTPDSARYYGERLLELALESGNQFYQGMGHFYVGESLIRLGQYDKAQLRHEAGIDIWEAVGAKEQLAQSYTSMGVALRRQGHLDEAMAFVKKGIALKQELNDTLSIAKPLLGVAAIYELQGDVFQSMAYNRKALAASQASQNLTLQGIAHICLANNYKSLGDVANASEQYLKARVIYDQLDDPMGTINVLNNLSVLLIDNKEYEEVEQFLADALTIAESQGLFRAMAFTNANLGYLWTSQGKDEEGLAYFQAAYELVKTHDLSSLTSYIEAELGNTLLAMERWDEAETYLLSSLTASLESGIVGEIAFAQISVSDLYQQKGDWNQALTYAEQAMKQAQNLPDPRLQLDITKQLLAIRIHFGQKGEAARLYQELLLLQDSVYNEENKRSLIEQEYQYEYRQQAYQDSVSNAIQLARKDQENMRRRTISYFLMGVLGLTLVFGLILWNRFRLTRRQKQIIEDEKGKLDQAYFALDEEKSKVEEANTKLRELDRFKSRFFTNLSHEFRTPLTVIGGMTQQIEQDPKRWLKKGNQIIQKNVSNLLNLINQILDLRKLESGRLSLSVVQGDVVGFLKLQTEAVRSLADDKELSLRFHSDLDELMMDFDPDKLLLVHTNLVSNAIKFTPPGGEVDVRVEQVAPTQLLLAVKDTGIGIPAENIPLIFDRFYQADNEHTQVGEGTGIGLSLTKELVQFMEGRIEVDSTPDQGTTFQVYLPITQLAAPQIDLVPAQTPMALPQQEKEETVPIPTSEAGNQPSLLIIEDNPDVVMYLQASLEDAYHLLIARNGQEGIDMALAHVPDLIISDVMMPEKNGYEVTHFLKSDERTSHIPIVLLTAKADHDSRLVGLEKGADAYLTKPFDQRELFIRLEKLLALRRHLQLRYANAAAIPPPKEAAFELEDEFIHKIRSAFLAHLDNSTYRIEDLCRDLGTSRTQLHNKIKALTGKSTSIFLRSIRLEKAKELMLQPEQRITEIAYATGFTDPNYFTRVFTKEFGVSPRDWREAH